MNEPTIIAIRVSLSTMDFDCSDHDLYRVEGLRLDGGTDRYGPNAGASLDESQDLAVTKAIELKVPVYCRGELYYDPVGALDQYVLNRLPSDALASVLRERGRQDAKWGEQNHPDLYWLGILGEEFGEVCKECVEEGAVGSREDSLRTELTHVTAVGLQWIEAIDRRRKNRPS